MEVVAQPKIQTVASIQNIDEVIAVLETIIERSKLNDDPLGYFAALYKKVTIKVKEGIADNTFKNGARMEKLDIIFASRYLDAYAAYQKNKPVTESWEKAFKMSKKYWPIVLQHLLIGMNAHINLDLGIAAAEVMKGKDINDLKGDFDKINGILSSLVQDVEKDLSEIWPRLKTILKWTGSIDNFLINFSMGLARDGAWDFAVELAGTPSHNVAALIKTRDQSVAKIGNLITNPGWIASMLFNMIRLGEKGSVADKIEDMEH